MVQRSRSFGCAKKPCRNTLQFAWLASGWCVAGVSCSRELGTKKIRRRGRLRSTIIQGFRFTAESSHTICSNLKCPIIKLTVADSVYFWRNEVAPNSNSSASRNLRISSKLILFPHCLQQGKIFTRSERAFLHEPMRILMDPVNATPGHTLFRHKLLPLTSPQPPPKQNLKVFRLRCRNSYSDLLDYWNVLSYCLCHHPSMFLGYLHDNQD